MRYRRDARQRFATKSKRRDTRQVVGAANLARRMALNGKPRVLRLHSFAIILDTNQLLAAIFDRDGDAMRPSIERVLDQLLDDRCRALDDFAGGDLIREVVRKAMDFAHQTCETSIPNPQLPTPKTTSPGVAYGGASNRTSLIGSWRLGV